MEAKTQNTISTYVNNQRNSQLDYFEACENNMNETRTNHRIEKGNEQGGQNKNMKTNENGNKNDTNGERIHREDTQERIKTEENDDI